MTAFSLAGSTGFAGGAAVAEEKATRFIVCVRTAAVPLCTSENILSLFVETALVRFCLLLLSLGRSSLESRLDDIVSLLRLPWARYRDLRGTSVLSYYRI